MTRRYALRDDQWDRIKDLLPGRDGHVGVTAKNNRLFVEAVLYRYRAGRECQFNCVRTFHGGLSSTDCSRQTLGKEDDELRVGGSPFDGRLPMNAKIP